MQQEELIRHFFTQILNNHGAAEKYYSHVTTKFPSIASYHFYCGLFLWQTCQKPKQAKPFFEKAMQLDSKQELILGNYALFLQIQKEGSKETIQSLYEQAIELAPENLFNLTNYVGFLFSQQTKRSREDAIKILDKILYSEDFIEKNSDLACECWFLALLYCPERKKEIISNLKLALHLGGRSLGWDFTIHINYAKEQRNNPNVEKDSLLDLKWILNLEKIISKGADLSLLQEWKEWEESNDSLDQILNYHGSAVKSLFHNSDKISTPNSPLRLSDSLKLSQIEDLQSSSEKNIFQTSKPTFDENSSISWFAPNSSASAPSSPITKTYSSPKKSKSNSPSPVSKSKVSTKVLEFNLENNENDEELIFRTPTKTVESPSSKKRKSPSSTRSPSPKKQSNQQEEISINEEFFATQKEFFEQIKKK